MEARGEDPEGQRAVTHVLFNRRDHRKGDRWNTIAQVCLDWLQFSGWRENDPNFSAAMRMDLNFDSARECAISFLAGWSEHMEGIDPTHGSRHYHASYVKPYWAVAHTPTVTIGRHIFYNDIR